METELGMDWAGKRGYRMIFNEESAVDCEKYKEVLSSALGLADIVGKECNSISCDSLHTDE